MIGTLTWERLSKLMLLKTLPSFTGEFQTTPNSALGSHWTRVSTSTQEVVLANK